MAKSRKKYSKRPLWQWVIFYLIIGGIIYFLLFYSGILNNILPNSNQNPSDAQEVEYFE